MSLPTDLQAQVRRAAAELYEEHARARAIAGAGASWRPLACWDLVEIHPDERAPHGVFFRHRPVPRATESQLIPRAPAAIQPLSLAPHRQR